MTEDRRNGSGLYPGLHSLHQPMNPVTYRKPQLLLASHVCQLREFTAET